MAATDVHGHIADGRDKHVRRRHHRQRTTFNLIEIDKSAQLVCRLNRLSNVLSTELRHIEIESARSSATTSGTQRRTCRLYIERSIKAAVDSARMAGDRKAERRLGDVQYERRRRLSTGAAGSANDAAEYQPRMMSGRVNLRCYVDQLIGTQPSVSKMIGERLTSKEELSGRILGPARSYTDVGTRGRYKSFDDDGDGGGGDDDSNSNSMSSGDNDNRYFNELYYYYNKMRSKTEVDGFDKMAASITDESQMTAESTTTAPHDETGQPGAKSREKVAKLQAKSLTTLGFETPARPRRAVTFLDGRRTKNDVTREDFAGGSITHRGMIRSSSSNRLVTTADKLDKPRAELYRQLTNLYSYDVPSGTSLTALSSPRDLPSATVTCHLGHHSVNRRRHDVTAADYKRSVEHVRREISELSENGN